MVALDRAALEKRYPQANWKDIEVGLFEPEFGVLMARRAVQTLVKQFVRAGGEYRLAAVKPPDAVAAAQRRGAVRRLDRHRD